MHHFHKVSESNRTVDETIPGVSGGKSVLMGRREEASGYSLGEFSAALL